MQSWADCAKFLDLRSMPGWNLCSWAQHLMPGLSPQTCLWSRKFFMSAVWEHLVLFRVLPDDRRERCTVSPLDIAFALTAWMALTSFRHVFLGRVLQQASSGRLICAGREVGGDNFASTLFPAMGLGISWSLFHLHWGSWPGWSKHLEGQNSEHWWTKPTEWEEQPGLFWDVSLGWVSFFPRFRKVQNGYIRSPPKPGGCFFGLGPTPHEALNVSWTPPWAIRMWSSPWLSSWWASGAFRCSDDIHCLTFIGFQFL